MSQVVDYPASSWYEYLDAVDSCQDVHALSITASYHDLMYTRLLETQNFTQPETPRPSSVITRSTRRHQTSRYTPPSLRPLDPPGVLPSSQPG